MGESVDFAAKFSYMNEFFTFFASNKKDNGKCQLVFLCVKCQPIVKYVKTDSDSPLTNLREHFSIKHQDYAPQFRNLSAQEWKRTRKSNKPSPKETPLNAQLRPHNGTFTF